MKELTTNMQAVMNELWRRARGAWVVDVLQSELCETLGLPQKTVSNAFTNLQRRGYLTRLAKGARNTKGRYRLGLKCPKDDDDETGAMIWSDSPLADLEDK